LKGEGMKSKIAIRKIGARTAFRHQARQKFPFATIRGDGRWACVKKLHPRWEVVLYVTQQRADRALIRRRTSFVVAVAPPTLDELKPHSETADRSPKLFADWKSSQPPQTTNKSADRSRSLADRLEPDRD
jgi:hypothetical protein